MATRRNSPIPATVAQLPRGILEILLQIATRSPHWHRAAGSSLEASHMDSTLRSLSLRRQVARGAFGDSTSCRSPSFARRGASARERLSTSAAAQTQREPLPAKPPPSRTRAAQLTRSRVAGEPQARCRRSAVEPQLSRS